MIALAKIPELKIFLKCLFEMAFNDIILAQNRTINHYPGTNVHNLHSDLKIDNNWPRSEIFSNCLIADFKIHEDFTYYVKTEIELINGIDQSFFIDESFYIINTNCGIMILFFDQNNMIDRLELNFKVEKPLPSFLLQLIEYFPSNSANSDAAIIKNIQGIGILEIDDYLKALRTKNLRVAEVD